MHLEVLSRAAEGEPHPTPLLFVHGAWHAAWCWEEHFLPFFAQQGWASYALSLRGHGNSEGRRSLRWLRLDDYVADLAQVAAQLPCAPVLVGHSMGGLVVQKYLEAQPAAAVVLLASVPPRWGAVPAALRMARRHPLRFLQANLTLSLYPLISSPELTRDAFFSATMPEAQVRAYCTRMQDEAYRAFLEMLGLSLPRPVRGKAPMLVLGAVNDRIISARDVAQTGQAYGVKPEIVPGMAHDMMLESGWEVVAARIASWLDEVVTPAGPER